jgi:hypothetical protein
VKAQNVCKSWDSEMLQKGVTLAMFVNGGVLFSVDVELGRSLWLYQEQANTRKNTTHSIRCIDAQSSIMI